MIFNQYYIFNSEVAFTIGSEPYALNLDTWTVELLQDIRTDPYISLLGPVYGSDPTKLTVVGNEVLLTAENTSSDDSDAIYTIRLNTPVSTEEKEDINVSIYPNPVVNGRLKINSDTQIHAIELYSVLGHKVYHIENNQSNQIELKLENLQPGNYLVRLIFEQNSIVKKIILN